MCYPFIAPSTACLCNSAERCIPPIVPLTARQGYCCTSNPAQAGASETETPFMCSAIHHVEPQGAPQITFTLLIFPSTTCTSNQGRPSTDANSLMVGSVSSHISQQMSSTSILVPYCAEISFISSRSPALAQPPGMITAFAPALAARSTISDVMSGFRL